MLNQRIFLSVRRKIVYVVLILLTFFSILPFIMLIVNSTRVHSQLINGFSFIPGKYFFSNLKNLLSNDNIPVVGALLNSVMVSVSAQSNDFAIFCFCNIFFCNDRLRNSHVSLQGPQICIQLYYGCHDGSGSGYNFGIFAPYRCN